MDVSIIVVNYNNTALLLEVISSILEKTKGIKYEIRAIDNNALNDLRMAYWENRKLVSDSK